MIKRSLLPVIVGLHLCPAATADARVDGPVSTTAYCLNGTMADGTYTRRRSAANNYLRLGTRIRIVGHPAGPNGMRRYVVRDRIGYGTTLDLWTETCGKAIQYGRRAVSFKIGWSRP